MNATRIFALLTCTLLALPALAQYRVLLKDTVIARFNDTDTRLMQDAIYATLGDPAADAAHDWKNDKSGASGSVSSVKAYESGTMSCRDIRITNHYKTQTGESAQQFCKDAKGAWKLVGPAK